MFSILASLTIAGAVAVLVPDYVQRSRLKKRIAELRLDAKQIGNAHQYIQLGEACRALGDWKEAGSAFETAVAKDPESLAARWGLALARFQQQRFDEAETLLRTILLADRRYKFGDVSLLLGKTLASLRKQDETVRHVREHLRLWRQPEAFLLLAMAHHEQGEDVEAAKTLDEMTLELQRRPKSELANTLLWRRRASVLRRQLQA